MSGGFSDIDRLCLSDMILKVKTLSYDKLRNIYGSCVEAYLGKNHATFKDTLMVKAAIHNNTNNHLPRLTDHGSYVTDGGVISVSKIEVNASILRPWSLYYKFTGDYYECECDSLDSLDLYGAGQLVNDEFDFPVPQPYMKKLLIQLSNISWLGVDTYTQLLAIDTHLFNPVSVNAKYSGNPHISSVWSWFDVPKKFFDQPEWFKIESLNGIPKNRFDRVVDTFEEIPAKTLAHFVDMPADENFTNLSIWIDARGLTADLKITPIYDTMKV
jgi:hypothetical protein